MSILSEVKADRVRAMRSGLDALMRELAAIGPTLGGRFILYGSAARDELRYDSDVDLLLDFPPGDPTHAAWRRAEELCHALKLEHDIQPIAWCSPAFLEHIMPDARLIPGPPRE